MSQQTGLDFIVNKSAWHKTRWVDAEVSTDLEPGQVLGSPTGVPDRRLPHDVQRAMSRAFCMVFLGPKRSKNDHHSVAGILVHDAVLPLNGRAEALK